ncbi:MAG: nitronate monooxygenase [Ilumatobacteraceae bacterium]
MTDRPAGPADRPAPVRTRVTDLLGIDYPVVQAPMGWIARSQLASAVSRAGGLGIIETSSGELDAVRDEIVAMRTLNDRPFGVNIAQAFVRDPAIVEFVVEQGVQFVTTSAGDPTKYTAQLKAAGLTVFHVVPTLAAALKAVDAGVDGLVVEGGEGGGFKNPRDVSSMVLLPLVRSKVDVPIIAAGGITDGASMAAAFALGAEGVQMGTRMVSAAESPVHQNWKDAIVGAAETDTVFLNRFSRPDCGRCAPSAPPGSNATSTCRSPSSAPPATLLRRRSRGSHRAHRPGGGTDRAGAHRRGDRARHGPRVPPGARRDADLRLNGCRPPRAVANLSPKRRSQGSFVDPRHGRRPAGTARAISRRSIP